MLRLRGGRQAAAVSTTLSSALTGSCSAQNRWTAAQVACSGRSNSATVCTTPGWLRSWQRQQHAAMCGAAAATGASDAADSGLARVVTAARPKPLTLKSRFCRLCGAPMNLSIPTGESEWRHVCTNQGCNYIDYFNPKMVVGCIVECGDRVLLCRRGIEPARGRWTLPAGFMEIGESSAAGAARETREEANAEVEVLSPYAHWDIPVIGQTYMLFRSRMVAPFTFSPGPETLETALVHPSDIPFDDLAFSSISITMRCYLEDLQSGTFHMHHGVIDKQPGSGPNDTNGFALRDHFKVPTLLQVPTSMGISTL